MWMWVRGSWTVNEGRGNEAVGSWSTGIAEVVGCRPFFFFFRSMLLALLDVEAVMNVGVGGRFYVCELRTGIRVRRGGL